MAEPSLPGPAFPCVDAHVHLHPASLVRAIERRFAAHGWLTAHPFDPAAVADTRRGRGVRRVCFFSYAHKPGMSRELNRWLAGQAARLPEAIALGTLHPDDPDLDEVAREASAQRRPATSSCSTWARCRTATPSPASSDSPA